ncbi:hypothetical protein [Amycolatopsis panacis]|uniref:hypothetical protein n=1 Tax=Amycolatopsis panacis TaxID=2340917 RepID=UPI000E731FDB|nr:hypothetical protein [Amycolatopsis panacis]
MVLLESDTGLANWFPIELFEVVDGALPANWRFATRDEGETGLQAIWGYPELVDDPSYNEDLVEREAPAAAVFAAQVAAYRKEVAEE